MNMNMYVNHTSSLTADVTWSSALQLVFSNSISNLANLYESSLLPWQIILFLRVIFFLSITCPNETVS